MDKKKSGLSCFLVIFSVLLLLAAAAIFSVSFFVIPTKDTADWVNIGSVERGEIGKPEAFAKVDYSTDSTASDWNYGRPAGKDCFPDDGEYYYVANPCDNDYLYKVSKNEPRTSQKLADISASMINVVDGKVYFINKANDSSFDTGIYCVNADGTGLECMSKGSFQSLYVINNWLYFIDSTTNTLTKMNTSARSHIAITDKCVTRFSITENNIYYVTYTEEYDYNYYSLERMNVNGKNSMVVCKVLPIDANFFVADRVAYFVSPELGVYTVNCGSGNISTINNIPVLTNLAKKNNKLYFIDKENDYTLCVYDLSTGTTTYTNLTQVSGFDLADNLIAVYYRANGTTPKVTVNDLSTGKSVPFFN